MYTSFFGLNEKPFSITPDPRYLFMSERHTEALAHLLYGVKESGGFIQLTGEVGTGKTTLVRSLLEQLPESADVAVVLNPQLSRVEFLGAICDELGIPLPERHDSVHALTQALNARLLSNHGRGRRTILIVDEAQNLRVDVLEQVRLLTNLETTKQKLLQIILIGQPELRELLARNDMRQLAQRVTGRYHLEPLTREEADAYVDHRLRVAGAVGQIFPAAAKRELFRLSGGVPRMINVLADRTLLGAFTRDLHQASPALVRSAAAEIYDRADAGRPRWQGWLRTGGYATGVAAGIALLAWMGLRLASDDGNATVAPLETPPPRAAAGRPPQPPAAPVPRAETPAADLAPAASLPAVLAAAGGETGTDQAFQTLFGLWNVEYASGPMRACRQAEAHQLFCLFQRGALSQVRSLDRPVILTLRDTDGLQHHVVLAGLDEAHAVLRIGQDEHRIGLDELADYWFGEYLLLWRPAIGRVKAFFPGMQDPDVRWIRESLAKIEGQPVVPMGSDVYDEPLEDRVRQYQRERRLTVDGLVGQQTQIAMNTDLGAGDRPRLNRVN